jgi:hypothetical protein
MKSSRHNDHLTQNELEDFLRGNLQPGDKQRVEKLLEDCELSREAVKGYAAVPAAFADLPALQKQVAVKSGLANPVWLNTILIGGVIAAIGTAGYFFMKDDSGLPGKIAVKTEISSPAFEEPVVLSPEAENFINPEAKPQKPLAVKQKSKSDSAKGNVVPGRPVADPGPGIPVSPPEPLESPKPVIPKQPSGYNAPVGYIFDLKITEFDNYYRGGTIEVPEIELRGVPAQFEDSNQRDEAEKEETVRQVPAEKFLREGLLAFRDGHYGRCIEKMEVLNKHNAADLNAAFYMGVCYVKLEMFRKAIPLLDQVLASGNNVFHEEAKWYKAQALIGNGQQEEGNKLLREIADGDGFYKQKAADMLR